MAEILAKVVESSRIPEKKFAARAVAIEEPCRMPQFQAGNALGELGDFPGSFLRREFSTGQGGLFRP